MGRCKVPIFQNKDEYKDFNERFEIYLVSECGYDYVKLKRARNWMKKGT